MSQAKLLKTTTAISDLATEAGVSTAQKIATLRAVDRHVQGLIRKLEGEDPGRNRKPEPIAAIQS